MLAPVRMADTLTIEVKNAVWLYNVHKNSIGLLRIKFYQSVLGLAHFP